MIFSSKVWSCSLTESLESPSLSSKLGSTEKTEHPNLSEADYGSGTAPLLSACLMEGSALLPFSRAQNHQEPPECSLGEKKGFVYSSQRGSQQSNSNTTSPPAPLPVPIWALKRSCRRDTSAERMSIPRRTTCKHRTVF